MNFTPRPSPAPMDEVTNGRTRVNASVDPDDPDSWAAFRRGAAGAVLTMTAPEVPIIFQGQEWGDDRWFDDERDLDWSQRDDNAGTVALWRDLMMLRTGSDDRTPGLRGDQIRILVSGNSGVIVYLRWGVGGEEAAHLVVLNLNDHDTTTSIEITGDWHCVLDTTSIDYHHTGTDTMPAIQTDETSASVTIPANGAAIFVR